eukprot:TRINITY_DN16008_c0_g3_i1.p1 TRINITY_DN16008_c0_g3~~TRINITY_DN16008_c0_g3_i1.p1  ORF type:complete len:484 (-),score=92.46 TRINITY_DN16008_c0_g3_i1:157-1608(-)
MASWAQTRWLPKHFTESSQVGGLFTVVAYGTMVAVCLAELASFLTSDPTSTLLLDKMDDELIQINFDIDIHDIECRNVKAVIYSQMNDEPLPIASQDFWLRSVDLKGRTFGMAMRPPSEEEDDMLAAMGDHDTIMKRLEEADGKSELDADWLSSHDGFKHKSFEHVIQGHDFTMINFFASWCGHCQKFSPTWNELAKKVHGEGEGQEPMKFQDRDSVARSVRMIKMNCVDFQKLCFDKGVDAYPMIRLYKADGTFSVYEGRRTPEEILRWVERTVKMKSYGWADNHEAFERGCNAKGRIQVHRVPGHLEFMAGGGDQTLNPRMTNVSHSVKHFSFSDPEDGKHHRKGWKILPDDIQGRVSPLDGRKFVTNQYHQAWIHDFKVVSTVSPRGQTSYQFTHQHRLSSVEQDKIPQAQFHFDIEPFSIHLGKEGKRWYEFTTSLMAILGGIYAVMRLMSNAWLGVVLSMARKNARAAMGGLGGGFYD